MFRRSNNLMKNESAFDSLAQNQEEIDLLKMVYPDLVSISDDGRIMAKLSDDIDVTFTLPEGYPEKCSPKHQITAPIHMIDIMNEIDDKLNENYKAYAGLQVLISSIPEINNIVNHGSQGDVELYRERPKSPPNEDKKERPRSKRIEPSKPKPKRFNWISGDILEDRKSTFQGHLVEIRTKEEAMEALAELKEIAKIERATHNIYAYFVTTPDGLEQFDCEDDGEKGAGAKLMQMLRLMKVQNMIVVVSRWYGGIHLSTDRFRHICNVARRIVVQYQESTGKK